MRKAISAVVLCAVFAVLAVVMVRLGAA